MIAMQKDLRRLEFRISSSVGKRLYPLGGAQVQGKLDSFRV